MLIPPPRMKLAQFMQLFGARASAQEAVAALSDLYERIRPAIAKPGLNALLVKPGDPVSKDTPLARVVNVYGDEVEILRSPVDGAVVLGMQEFPLVTTGSWVAELGILAPE